MRENYQPSSAPLVQAGQRPPRSSVVAVLLGGFVVDVLGSMLFVGLLLTAVAAVSLGGADATGTALTKSTTFVALAFVGASLLVVGGGYTAAWWARRRPIAHAAGAGILSLGFAVLGLWLQHEAGFGWVEVGSVILHLPLAVLGGYLFARAQPALA